METCKYGSGAGKRKPTAVKRKGVVCRAYKITVEKLDNDLTMLGDKLSKSFGNIKVAGI